MGEAEKSPRRTIKDTALKEGQTWNKVKKTLDETSLKRALWNKGRNGFL